MFYRADLYPQGQSTKSLLLLGKKQPRQLEQTGVGLENPYFLLPIFLLMALYFTSQYGRCVHVKKNQLWTPKKQRKAGMSSWNKSCLLFSFITFSIFHEKQGGKAMKPGLIMTEMHFKVSRGGEMEELVLACSLLVSWQALVSTHASSYFSCRENRQVEWNKAKLEEEQTVALPGRMRKRAQVACV
jgi:hypothetical protein